MTVKAKVFKGTWMGRPGTDSEWSLSKSRYGARVAFHQWADESTGTLRVISGNGYTDPANFVEYYKVEGVEPEAVQAFVEALS